MRETKNPASPFDGVFYEDRRNRRFNVLVEDVARYTGMRMGNLLQTLARRRKNQPNHRVLFSTVAGKPAISRRCIEMLYELLPRRRGHLQSILDAMDAFSAERAAISVPRNKVQQASLGEANFQDGTLEDASQEDLSDPAEADQEAWEESETVDSAHGDTAYPAGLPVEFRKVYTICKATEVVIGGRVTLGVDAEELHRGLGVGRKWTDWIADMIRHYFFQEGKDFDFRVLRNQDPGASGKWGGDRRSKACTLSLDCAKQITMAQRNPTGRLVRRYYLWCEDTLARTARDQSSGDLLTFREQLSQLTTNMNAQAAQASAMLEAIRELSNSVIELKSTATPGGANSRQQRQRQRGEISISDFCLGRPISRDKMFQYLTDIKFIEKNDYTGQRIATSAGLDSGLLINIPPRQFVDGGAPYGPFVRLTAKGVQTFGNMISTITEKGDGKSHRGLFTDENEPEEDSI